MPGPSGVRLGRLCAAAARKPRAPPIFKRCDVALAVRAAASVAAPGQGLGRQRELAPAEGALDLLRSIQGESQSSNAEGGSQEQVPGLLLSVGAAVARADLPGPVAVGRAVAFADGGRGVVLRYDQKGAVVAPLEGAPTRAGAEATVTGDLHVRLPESGLPATGVSYISVVQALVEASPISDEGTPLLRLPAMPAAARRRPVRRRLPTGLAVLEALQPLGEGHRVGLVGPPGTGKLSAVRALLAAQDEDTVCVYAASRALPKLRQHLDSAGGARVVCVHADPAQDPPVARYVLPLVGLRLAQDLLAKHRHVLLVIDDVLQNARAAEDLGVLPIPPSQAIAAALDAGGCVVREGGGESALSVVTVFDIEARDEAMEPAIRDLWRSCEGSMDVCLHFAALADGYPVPSVAIDLEELLSRVGLVAPAYQVPFMRLLRTELLRRLRRARELEQSLELKTQLGLHHDIDEDEDVGSLRTARALLMPHALSRRSGGCEQPQQLPEIAVLLCAAAVLHFPGPRPSAATLAGFQKELVATIRDGHPALWSRLAAADAIAEAAEAAGLLRELGETLLQHRGDFQLTRPVW